MSGNAVRHRPARNSGSARLTRITRPGPIGIAALAILLGFLASGAALGQPAPDVVARPVLRVVTGYASPFVKPPGTPVSGYSIEIWQEIARRLGVETAWTVLPDLSDDEQLLAVTEGRADLALSALAITPEGEAKVDFSVPYFSAGLQILVGTEDGGGVAAMLGALASPAMLGLAGTGFSIVLVLAHVLWLVERRHNPLFQQGYRRAVLEGLWGVTLIIATGEHGDRETPRLLKRLIVGSMWLFGVILIAQFTATVTATLTVDQLRSSIQGPADLPGKTIATAPGSVAAAWLTTRGLPFVPVSDSEQAYGMLIRGEIQAIVYGAPQLRHWLSTRGSSAAALVGPVFRPQQYAIAVPIGSELRRRINAALLSMQADGTAEEIEQRWFSTMH